MTPHSRRHEATDRGGDGMVDPIVSGQQEAEAPRVPAAEAAADWRPPVHEPEGLRTRIARGLSGWRGAGRVPTRKQQRLIESLNEVAAAISSTMSTTDVLNTVVEEAKHLVASDKAVLCLLAPDREGFAIDESAVFVRGRRNQYPEDWWRERIDEAATCALEECIPNMSIVDGTRLMTVPVKSRNRPIGILAVMNPMSRRFTEDQIALIAVLAAFAGTAIENARLHAQSQAALLADERTRIAKEMHDGLSQSLFGTSLELDVCRKRVKEHPDEVEQRLDHVQTILVRSLSELRRYIHDLRPVSLNSLGLVGAISQRVTEIGEAKGMSVRVYAEGEERALPPGPESCLYRVALEAVANTAKHSEAQRSIVMLRYTATEVSMVVEDDGQGFDVSEARGRGERGECIGLESMRDRVKAEGGRFSARSGERGTTIQVVLPC